uniref:Uncharacterized protein n=1 Tax=Rhizophora mucronata TaxID=61149 RepID=A0A2P2N807_RHIMU
MLLSLICGDQMMGNSLFHLAFAFIFPSLEILALSGVEVGDRFV